MPSRSLSVLIAALSVLAPAQCQTQAQPAPAQTSEKIEITAQEVVLDLVVRDKKGRLIRDLKPDEIEVLEEGSPQKVREFRLVEGKGNAAPSGAAAFGKTADPLRQVRLVTLVFDNLGPDGKRFFRQATNDLLNLGNDPNLYYALYTIDQNLHLLQDFTTNHSHVREQMVKAQTGSYVTYAARSQEVLESLRARAAQAQAAAAADPSSGQAYVEGKLAQMQIEAAGYTQAVERGMAARATLYSLQALVRSQARLPGRKMLVYFTEEFTVPDELLNLFRSVVGNANRANVAIYTVDANGLIATGNTTDAERPERGSSVSSSPSTAGRGAINDAARESQNQMKAANSAATKEQILMQDKVLEGLHSSSTQQLIELANETGGFAITDTNDLKTPLRRSMEELETYYEAAYTPQLGAYDGKFRRVSVKVSRPDAVVHSRAGYFALPPGRETQQVFAFESPLLMALNEVPLPQAMDFRATALRFSQRGNAVQYTLALELPMKALDFRADKEKKTAVAHASLLALVKDEKGEVVQKFSQDFPRQVPLDKVDAFRNGNLIQTFRAALPPGKYTLEAAAFDQNAAKAAAKRTEIVVPPPSERLGISSISLIRRLDPPSKDADDPFSNNAGKVVPELSGAVQGGAGRQVSFYFVIYLSAARSEAPELTMSFYQGGQLLGASKPQPGKADEKGRIPYIAGLRAESFAPGEYEMRASVKQGPESAEEKIVFTVQ